MARPKKIVVATHHGAEFENFYPVVAELRKSACEVIVFALDPSATLWRNAGEKLADLAGQPPLDYIRAECPDLVLAGLPDLSSVGVNATSLPLDFALAANAVRDVNLGFIEDLPGVHTRSTAIPDFVCLSDPYGEHQIRLCPRYESRSPDWCITGAPTLDTLDAQTDPARIVDRDVHKIVCNLPRNRTILIVGQDDVTTPLIQGVVTALTPAPDWTLILRLHPRSRAVCGDEVVNGWYNTLSQYPGNMLNLQRGATTEQLLPFCGTVVGVDCNVLTKAALVGARVISWTSDPARRKLTLRLGYKIAPQAANRAAYQVEDATTFLASLACPPLSADAYKKSGNTARVVRFIKHHLGIETIDRPQVG